MKLRKVMEEGNSGVRERVRERKDRKGVREDRARKDKGERII